MMARLRRCGIVVATGVALLVVPASGALAAVKPAQARAAVHPPSGVPATPTRAYAARAMTATDTAHLRYVSASGSLLLEEGKASGTLPGSMRVHFDVGATFSGSFTIYAGAGSITGHGVAVPHGAGVYESFSGSLTVTGGSGRYAHAHGQARLYGTFNRNTYALLVQTVGTLHY
jgi:hypothetical protein